MLTKPRDTALSRLLTTTEGGHEINWLALNPCGMDCTCMRLSVLVVFDELLT
jgi:hypothetical protein